MWEYKVIGLNSGTREDHLNELGAQGWELVNFDGGMAHMKRWKAESGGIPVKDPQGVTPSKQAVPERVKTGRELPSIPLHQHDPTADFHKRLEDQARPKSDARDRAKTSK